MDTIWFGFSLIFGIGLGIFGIIVLIFIGVFVVVFVKYHIIPFVTRFINGLKNRWKGVSNGSKSRKIC